MFLRGFKEDKEQEEEVSRISGDTQDYMKIAGQKKNHIYMCPDYGVPQVSILAPVQNIYQILSEIKELIISHILLHVF